MRKTAPRLTTYTLWLVTAVLLCAGAYAASAQQGPDSAAVQSGDSAVVSTPQAVDSQATPLVETPPAEGVGQPEQTAASALRDARLNVNSTLMDRFISLVGVFLLLLIGWSLSTDRRAIPWRVLLWGVGLQFIFAILILKTPFGQAFFSGVNSVVVQLLGFTEQGARFLFGNLVQNNVPIGAGDVGNSPISVTSGNVANTGAYFAFNVLPTIIFFSSLMTMLYHMGVMQKVVKGVAWVMMRTMRTSGAETLSSAGNIFLGQTEAPLLIKPFVKTMTISELHCVMTGGFATVAGGVMAAYVGMLLYYFPDIAGHLMAASVMSAPAAIVFAKLMLPEKEVPVTSGSLDVDVEKVDANVIDAAARGAGEGLQLALNVGAMLLAFIALIALINALFGWVGDITGIAGVFRGQGWMAGSERLTLEWLLGRLLAPLAFFMGVPWKDATEIGTLLGIKTAVNEFVGYLGLANMLQGGANLSPRSIIIATYAMCGFANFSSIAIQIGGIGGLAPSRRSDLARIGMRAMIAGTLASFLTAAIAGILI
ncbi:MAG TPA: nucleoside transporter C-terminal domain-containing protein [Longimicrobiales bacterium]